MAAAENAGSQQSQQPNSLRESPADAVLPTAQKEA
jgi:hypothetical protein